MKALTADARRGLRLLAGVSVALLLVLAVAGCGGAAGGIPNRTVAPKPTQSVPQATPQVPEPTRITLPTLDVTAPIMKLGLTENGKLEVPPGAERAGWYTGSPAPGAKGPAIIAAHINWSGEPGPFADLPELEPSDRVRITREDGSVVEFRVTKVESYPKSDFPTQKVYSDIPFPGLRLITCGGEFMEDVDSYTDNIVAYARLV